MKKKPRKTIIGELRKLQAEVEKLRAEVARLNSFPPPNVPYVPPYTQPDYPQPIYPSQPITTPHIPWWGITRDSYTHC